MVGNTNANTIINTIGNTIIWPASRMPMAAFCCAANTAELQLLVVLQQQIVVPLFVIQALAPLMHMLDWKQLRVGSWPALFTVALTSAVKPIADTIVCDEQSYEPVGDEQF